MIRRSLMSVSVALAVSLAVAGYLLTPQVLASADEADAARLHRAILQFVTDHNPEAPIKAFQEFPGTLLAEAVGTGIDHCIALAQAQVESKFRHDAVGAAGEIGLYQILPSTAALFERAVGPFRRPVLSRGKRDLGDLADPAVSTRYAMAYLRDIMTRKPGLREALTEYNGGPAGRRPEYYRTVMTAYVELLDRGELGCRYQATPRRPAVMALLTGV
jgi:soluble lytic murein transglycosylase-like protein